MRTDPPVTRGGPSHMQREAGESAQAVARMLEANASGIAELAGHLRTLDPSLVVTCARGSSDHAATYAKYVIETLLGRITASASPAIASLYDSAPRMRGALYLVISQSGRSPDLLRSAMLAKSSGALVVALVNQPQSPLAQLAHVVLPLHAGPESSVAATKSYVCTLAGILQLVAAWAEDLSLQRALSRLPDVLDQAWRCDWSSLTTGLRETEHLFVLGRGPGLGVAMEAALKLKETCGLHAEAFSSAEVRHGPMALVGPGFPVLCFAQPDASLAGTRSMAEEFRMRGAPVWLADPEAGGRNHLPVPVCDHPALTPLAEIVSFYRAVNDLALLRGFDPDAPPHLNKVTETV